MRTFRHSLAVLALLAPSLVAPVRAQDVQYTSVSSIKFSGPLGGLMNLAARMGGASGESLTTTSIKDAKLRGDSDKTSTIIDLDGGRFINIDHGKKTYTIMTMQQMAQMVDQAGAQAKEAQAQQASQKSNAQGEVDFEFDMKVDRTGEKQKVNGYDAERYIITMKTDLTVTPEGQTKKEDAGTVVVLTELWNAKDLPIGKASEKFATAAPGAARKSGALNLATAFSQNPKLGEALEKAAEEAAKIEGIAVKETMYMVLVPPGLDFDRQLALAGDKGGDKAQGGGIKGIAKGALGGMLGGKKQEAPKEEAKPQQATIFTSLSEIRDIQVKALPATLFDPPAGYKEVPFTMPSR